MPFTNDASSAVAYFLASSTASFMDTLSGIESTNIISHMARRSMARVVLGSLDFFQPMEYLSITASTASIFSNTAFAREEAKTDSEKTSASAA